MSHCSVDVYIRTTRKEWNCGQFCGFKVKYHSKAEFRVNLVFTFVQELCQRAVSHTTRVVDSVPATAAGQLAPELSPFPTSTRMTRLRLRGSLIYDGVEISS